MIPKNLFFRDTLIRLERLMVQKLSAINTRNFIIIMLVHHSQKMFWLLNFLRNHCGECKKILSCPLDSWSWGVCEGKADKKNVTHYNKKKSYPLQLLFE